MKKHATEMSPAELDAAEAWFDETRSGITANEVILKGEFDDAPFGPVRDGINLQKVKLVRVHARLDRAEEAFFTELTKALEPPSQQEIDETRRLTLALADRIIAEKTSQAVLALVDDLANFVTRVLA